MSQETPAPSVTKETAPHWFRWILGALFVASLFIVFHQVLKPWRIRHWDWQADRMAAVEDWTAVLRYAPKGLSWDPSNSTLQWLQVRAEIGENFTDADQLELPLYDPDMTPQGLLAAAEIYQGTDQWEKSAEILPLLADSIPRDPRVMLLFARQALQEERIEAALDWSRALVATVPDDPSTQLFAARTRLLEADLFASLQAVRHLFTAAADPGSDGATALRLLVDLFNGMVFSPAERSQLASLIEAHPLAGARERLTASLIRLQEKPEDRDQIIASMVSSFRESDPILLSQWLQGIGEYEKSLEILESAPTDNAVASNEAVQMQLGAYLSLGKDAEALDFLARYEGAIGTSDSEFIRFILMVREGNRDRRSLDEQARKTLNAIQEASDPRSLLVFSRISASAGLIDRALEALNAIDTTSLPPNIAAQVIYTRINLLIVMKRSRDAFELGMDKIEVVQQQPVMLNNITYIGLLLGREVSSQVERLRTLVDNNPGLGVLAGTLAYASLLDHGIAEAWTYYQLVPEEFRKNNSASILLGAMLAFENGEAEQARQDISRIDFEDLLPEEVAQLKQLAANLKYPINLP